MNGEEIRARLQADLRTAMKAGERATVSILRTSLAALGNAEAVRPEPVRLTEGVYAAEVSRRDLTDDDVVEVLRAVRAECAAGAEEMRRVGEAASAETLTTQAAIVERYLT